jgi:outer membrane protein assembly factor BamB
MKTHDWDYRWSLHSPKLTRLRTAIPRRFLFWLAPILLAWIPSLLAQGWPQWRGPGRDGVASGFIEPSVWPETLKRRWQVEVGIGHSSPVTDGRRIYLHTRREEDEVVSCLELASGKTVWQERHPVPYTMDPAAVAHGKGPKSTPALHQGTLYTMGISGIVSAYDAQTGKLLWRKEFSKNYKSTSPLYGTSMSPLADSGLLIVHVGGYNHGALMALDARTGKEQWSWGEDGPGHASPIVVELAGTRQVVTQTQRYLVGVAVRDGRLLWKVPFTTDYDQNTITPVLYQGTLLFSGYAKGIFALRINKEKDQWSAQKLWENPNESMYMSSPVVSGDRLFGFSHTQKGHFVSLDPRSGATLWKSGGRQGENAALVSVSPLLIMLTDDARLIVARQDGSAFAPIREYTVAASPTWAHPVVVGRLILIKDHSHLTLLSFE